ncbi:MAG: amidohydrolase family protein [Candidatus Bathyarchaeia archaeon]
MNGLIVDVHTHLPRHKQRVTVESAEVYRARPGHPVNMNALCWEDHFEGMKSVDKAIVFGIFRKGMENINDAVAEYVGLHPEKLIGFLSVDPNDGGAVDEVERGVNELKLKGIKLGPAYQNFLPFSDKACAVYSKAQDLGVPVLFHFGTTPGRLDPLEYTHPLLLEKVAIAFPELRMVIAHMGHPWMADTIVLIRKQPNVYADISALFYRPWQFYNALVTCNEYDQMHKLLFGTDWPVTTPDESIDHLRKVNRFTEGTSLPKVPSEKIEELIQRDALEALGIKH